MTTVTVPLPESLKAFIDSQIASKGYGSVSKYFGSLLRDAQSKEENARLEALLVEDLASQPIPLDSAFWKRLETNTEAIIERHSSRTAE